MVQDEELGRYGRHSTRWFTLVQEGALRADLVIQAVETLISDVEAEKKVLPEDGEVFELAHYFSNGDPPETMVFRHAKTGYSCFQDVRFIGNRLNGATRKGRFVLFTTSASTESVLDSGLRITKEKGRVPDGQWLEAMRVQFKLPTEEETAVAVADPSWLVREPRFPLINKTSRM